MKNFKKSIECLILSALILLNAILIHLIHFNLKDYCNISLADIELFMLWIGIFILVLSLVFLIIELYQLIIKRNSK